jgi:ribosomal protein S18 acetylase RimI-like enzyme
MTIRIFEENDLEKVIALRSRCFSYTAPHNDPLLSAERKTAMDDGLFFVSSDSLGVTGTVMAGWDGHRGWIYSLAVSPRARNRGYSW